MQKKNKQTPLSISPEQNTNSAQQNGFTSDAPANTPIRLHTSIYTLKLTPFKECVCRNDLSGLIISGLPTAMQLQKAYFDIWCDFLEMSDNEDVYQSLRLMREINKVKLQYLQVKLAVEYLSVQWDEHLVEMLRNYNFRYKFDYERKTEYSRDLRMILSRIIKWEIDLEIYQAELDAINAKNVSGSKIDDVYFTQTEIRLSRFVKYRINPDEISVAEFCLLKKEYIHYYEQVKQEQDARRR